MALALIVVVGCLLRIMPAAMADFPLNDGGLFFSMVQDIRSHGYALPASAGYNGLGIPFAYPPLGLYLAAIGSDVTGTPTEDVLRIFPAVISAATIPVVYGIGAEIFRSRGMALATAAFFAFSPRSYVWLIGGGGITRAPGFLFALIALLIAIRMYRDPSKRGALISGVALGAAALSHPQAAIFGGLSLVVTLPFLARDRAQALRNVCLVIGAAVLVTLPWLVAIVARHGPAPLISAAGTGGAPLDGVLLLLSSRTSGGAIEVMGVLTSIGLVVCAFLGAWLIPVWMIAIVVVDPRAGLTYASLPAAMAVVFLISDVTAAFARQRVTPFNPMLSNRLLTSTAILFVLVATAVGADSVAAQLRPDSPVHPLGPDERGAMSWVADSTNRDDRFLVVAGAPWEHDANAEWFPVLADRRSVGTVQGYEWLGADRFSAQRDLADRLVACSASSDASCLGRALDTVGDVDYVFLARSPQLAFIGRECCHQVADVLAMGRGVDVVFSNDAIVIARLGARIAD